MSDVSVVAFLPPIRPTVIFASVSSPTSTSIPAATVGLNMPVTPDRPSSIRKRHRPAHSCTECRRRKVRCDRVKPHCGQCRALDLTALCAYEENTRAQNAHRTASIASSTEQRLPRSQDTPEEAYPTSTPTPRRIQGTISKTRVYGHGHWMNAFSLVSTLR